MLQLLYSEEVTLTRFALARGVVSKLIWWTGLHTNTIRLIEWYFTAAYKWDEF